MGDTGEQKTPPLLAPLYGDDPRTWVRDQFMLEAEIHNLMQRYQSVTDLSLSKIVAEVAEIADTYPGSFSHTTADRNGVRRSIEGGETALPGPAPAAKSGNLPRQGKTVRKDCDLSDLDTADESSGSVYEDEQEDDGPGESASGNIKLEKEARGIKRSHVITQTLRRLLGTNAVRLSQGKKPRFYMPRSGSSLPSGELHDRLLAAIARQNELGSKLAEMGDSALKAHVVESEAAWASNKWTKEISDDYEQRLLDTHRYVLPEIERPRQTQVKNEPSLVHTKGLKQERTQRAKTTGIPQAPKLNTNSCYTKYQSTPPGQGLKARPGTPTQIDKSQTGRRGATAYESRSTPHFNSPDGLSGRKQLRFRLDLSGGNRLDSRRMLWTPELTKEEVLAKVDELFCGVKVHSVAVRLRKQQFRVGSDEEYEMVKEDLLKVLEEPAPDTWKLAQL